MAIAVTEVISLANAILVHVGLPRKVETLKQCNSSLFSQLYETLTGCRVPVLALQAPTSEAVKCQAVVDALNVHLSPHVRLDHIRGADVAQLDTISIKNLLDIFSVLFHVPPTSIALGDESEDAYDSYSEDSGGELEKEEVNEANDSNVISTEGMSVISEVLREELGHSSHSSVTDSTTELLRPVPVARLPPSIISTAAKHVQVPPQLEHKDRGSSVITPSNESSLTTSHPPSLTISTLQSTSTEGSSYDQRVISQVLVRETPQDSATATAVDTNRLQEIATAGGSIAIDGRGGALFIPSGESSIGTTPSPKLHTPPQSPQQHRQLSPLHHSTPHTSTRSRLFPMSSSTSTAISSSSSSAHPHPLGTAAITPSVTVARPRRTTEVPTMSYKDERDRTLPNQERSTISTLTTEESTLVPQSSPSPSGRSRLLQELTITDLHTTTMSSGGGVVGEELHVKGDHNGYGEDSYSTDSETPPPSAEVRPLHSVCTCTPQSSRTSTAAQKVRFSRSIEQRERARHESSLSSKLSVRQSDIEVGNLSSIEMKLSLDAKEDQTRANVLATLYQNFMSEMKKARPATSEKRVRTTGKTSGTATKGKLKSYSRPTSKVASSKHRKHDSGRNRSKKATQKSLTSRAPHSKRIEESPSEDSSEEESDSAEHGVRPSTPTKIAVGDNMFPLIERDFPFIHVSPSTAHRLLQKQLQQVTALTRSKVRQRNSTVKKMAEMEQKQKALLQIIKKELDHTKRMQCQVEQQREKVAVKSNIHAKRQAAARARRYYYDYELRLKAKLQRRRTREEQIFRRTFEEGLGLQRERIRELKRYAKERQDEHAKKHQDQLESMENYYRDQLSMLTESMMEKRKDTAIRDRAQNQMVQKMRRELRQKIETEIKELQQCIDREDDVTHFRELDAQNVRHKLSRMTFTTTVK